MDEKIITGQKRTAPIEIAPEEKKIASEKAKCGSHWEFCGSESQDFVLLAD